MVKTKIICTLGPASDRRAVLVNMMRAGMDVVRLNFSHGKLEEHLARIALVREINRKYRRRILILGDLEGYRVRVGRIKDPNGLALRKGQEVWLTARDVAGDGNILPFDYAGDLALIKKGCQIFIDDGNIALVADGRRKDALRAKVTVPGVVKEHKGINMPDVQIDFKGVTDRDRRHLAFCVKHKVDFVAQSFVRSREDIVLVRQELAGHIFQPRIIAKIENREGIRNIDSIMASCDGIMIARGDMGVSLPVYEVPMVQKAIIRTCNDAGKLVITATQMLESMTVNLRPTRAEVSDVANAIIDGTDYVMLSAETAVGANPVACVALMNKIIAFTEKNAR
ncbi:MAG: pyruvate kinase [Candidatus Omnitrophica bacterium]|nr:pyruvate kinase [Candidatus Omnitrophota bacterium]